MGRHTAYGVRERKKWIDVFMWIMSSKCYRLEPNSVYSYLACLARFRQPRFHIQLLCKTDEIYASEFFFFFFSRLEIGHTVKNKIKNNNKKKLEYPEKKKPISEFHYICDIAFCFSYRNQSIREWIDKAVQ